MQRSGLLVGLAAILLMWALMAVALANGQTLSRVALTQAGPLFNLAAIATVLSLWQYPGWRAAAVAMAMLTAWPVSTHPWLHHTAAIAMFGLSAIAIGRDKRLGWLLVPALLAILVLPWGLLPFEVVSIGNLLLYHSIYLWWNSAGLRRDWTQRRKR